MVDIAQLVRASDCGPEGRRFNSDYPPHFSGYYPARVARFRATLLFFAEQEKARKLSYKLFCTKQGKQENYPTNCFALNKESKESKESKKTILQIVLY